MTAPYQNVANGLASLGRYEDSYIIHAAEGETVVPEEVLNSNPSLKADLFKQMKAMGIKDPNRYVVGNALNSINPQTGQPEFFFKSLGKILKKAAPFIGTIIGAQFGPIGAAIGSGLGSLAGGASTEEALLNAGLSWAGTKFLAPGLDSGIASAGGSAANAMQPSTIGSSLAGMGESGLQLANALPKGMANMSLGTAAAAALAPAIGSSLMAPEESSERPKNVVDEYYAALARGENPPLPAELTPPPQSSLIPGTYGQNRYAGLPSIEDIVYRQDPVMRRPMFGPIRPMSPMYAAKGGGYLIGPGGPTDDKIPLLASNTEFVHTGKAVAGADPSGNNNPDEGAKVMMGIMRAFERRADENKRAAA